MNAPTTFRTVDPIPAGVRARQYDRSLRDAADVRTAALTLPAQQQVELIRCLADDLSFSYGADTIAAGRDAVAANLRQEDAVAQRGLEAVTAPDLLGEVVNGIWGRRL